MKYIGKAAEIRPDLSRKEILKMCPADFDIMKIKCETFSDSCEECWNREMPKVEKDNEKKSRFVRRFLCLKGRK